MSFRRSDDPRKKDDDVESQIPRSLGSNKSDHDYNKRLSDEQLREQESFISRSYWLCTCLFAVSFVAMATAVIQGVYKDVVLAENIMVSVLGTTYMVLFFVMCFCSSNRTLRVAILLFVSAFIGVVGGFLMGINLKMVVEKLEEHALAKN